MVSFIMASFTNKKIEQIKIQLKKTSQTRFLKIQIKRWLQQIKTT